MQNMLYYTQYLNIYNSKPNHFIATQRKSFHQQQTAKTINLDNQICLCSHYKYPSLNFDYKKKV